MGTGLNDERSGYYAVRVFMIEFTAIANTNMEIIFTMKIFMKKN